MVMKAIVSKLLGSFAPSGLKGMLVASAIGLAPTAAFAGHHDDFRIDLRIGSRGPAVEWRELRPRYYEDREVRVWVDPVYRTVCDHVWVPDRFEFRDVVEYHHGYRHIVRERVLVDRCHYQDVPRQELVCAGHWETHIERVPVR
jgi:hypothetical protein